MKDTTKQWLFLAEKDMSAAETLIEDKHLTNIVAFHSQQVIEKVLKACLEEKGKDVPKIHNLERLYFLSGGDELFEFDLQMLREIDRVYINSRYPAEVGLMPYGNTTDDDARRFSGYARSVYEKVLEYLSQKNNHAALSV
jgi:HEPN domain-containing protein